MKRASLNACFSFALAAALALGANAQTHSMHIASRHSATIEQPASTPEAHISLTTLPPGGTSFEIDGDRWSARGYSLKMLISQIYNVEAKRVDIADNFDSDTRYDVTLALPRDADEAAMQQLLGAALQKKFNITIATETRAMQVYVMSAPAGPGSQLHRHGNAPDDAGQITYSGRDCPGISSHGIEASATTISDFGHALEQDLDAVLIDETKLSGSYDFKLSNYSNTNQLLTLLHDQLGLLVRPLQRNVTVLKVLPQGQLASL